MDTKHRRRDRLPYEDPEWTLAILRCKENPDAWTRPDRPVAQLLGEVQRLRAQLAGS